MTLIRPFAALRPAAGRAGEVIAPPYDVLSANEARARASGKPWSFLHVSKPEIDLPPDLDPHDDSVYAQARDNLQRMIAAGVLSRDAAPAYYVYRLTMGRHVQTGLVAAASVEAYDANRIRKHEFTRPDKEDDRVRQIEAVGAQTGPVLLAYPDSQEVDGLLARVTAAPPDADATADDGIRHTLWMVRDEAVTAQLTRCVDAMPALYIADGHHRSAAASRVAAARRSRGEGPDGPAQRFLVVAFPRDQMQILPYNRVVADLHGMSPDAFLDALRPLGDLAPSADAVSPAVSGEFGVYLRGQWHRLRLHADRIPQDDPVRRLDVSLLAEHVLEPLLGITDPRRDVRIDFVGGVRGLEGLQARVDSGGMAAAFALYPTQMADLMAVADAGEVMPPKSTWFEPKLADGMASLVID
ncbi:MAG: DUF1015 family protein [Betaproteobacteria bacterium]|nr:DUF1015 family protein [Betaproteobacteria bacterium]